MGFGEAAVGVHRYRIKPVTQAVISVNDDVGRRSTLRRLRIELRREFSRVMSPFPA